MHYYGFDIHKKYSVFTCMDEQGQILRRGRVDNTPEALVGAVAPSGGQGKVVIETTGNWAYVYDTLEPWVSEVVLAHSLRVKAIAAAKVKTDRIDGDTLAHLLRADLVPTAYVPSQEVRDQRDWLRSRSAVVRMGTQLKNRIHALLAKDGLSSPYKDLFGKAGRKWLADLELRPTHRQILDRYLSLLDALQADIRVTTAAVGRQARQDHQAKLLMTIPGIGPLSALLFLAEVGEVRRFPTARQLVSYAGLAPRVRSSGGKTHLGHITKEGSVWLRWVFTEAATSVIAQPGPLSTFYQEVRQRHGSQTAAIALARKLLTIAYAVVKKGVPYRVAETKAEQDEG